MKSYSKKKLEACHSWGFAHPRKENKKNSMKRALQAGIAAEQTEVKLRKN